MNPEWQFLLDTMIRWLPYIAVVIFIPIAVLLVRCLSKGAACRNGPLQKIASYADEEYWMGDNDMLRLKHHKSTKTSSLDRHKSLPNMQENYASSDIFRSVSLTREESIGSLSDQVSRTITDIGPGLCSRCCTVYSDINVARNLPCSHHFHQKCAEDWFNKRGYCPQCIRPSSVSVIKG